MNTNELFQRTNIPEPPQQTKYSTVSAESIWGLGGLLRSGLFWKVHIQGIQSVKLLLISEKVKTSALLYPYPFP